MEKNGVEKERGGKEEKKEKKKKSSGLNPGPPEMQVVN